MIDVESFETHRPALIALAYRMLGDMGRAEDVVQDAWLRWRRHQVDVDSPKAFLVTVVTRLCLNELDSARSRREESRSDRLPEPVDLRVGAIGQLEVFDQISMAFLVVLQRLTPVERAVLLLHDIFNLSHAEIAVQLRKSAVACRQLLRRARQNVASERRDLAAPPEEHRRLLQAFLRASSTGEVDQMVELLADDATLFIDSGPDGRRVGRIRNIPRPVSGAKRIAAFLAAVSRQEVFATPDTIRECELNGQPAVVTLREGRPSAAVLIAVARGKICYVFVHADPARLSRVGLGH